MIDWYIKGNTYGACNCDHCCPCQFEGLPTHGHCQGFEVFQVEKGHFGDVDLAGARAAVIWAWPGPIFEGGGEMQIIIDDRVGAEQREALISVLSGEETAEGATHWWVFSAMSDTRHEDLVRRIDFESDMDARTARVVIDGLLQSTAEPIRSRVDGSPHRVRVQHPEGIEFEVAEIGNATSTSTAAIKFELNGTYGQFNELRHNGLGPAHNQRYE